MHCSRETTTSCIDKNHKQSGGRSFAFAALFKKRGLKKTFTKCCIAYLLSCCLSALVPPPLCLYSNVCKGKSAHKSYRRCSSAANRKPFKKLVSFAKAAEVSRYWVHHRPMGRECWRGVLWEGEAKGCMYWGLEGGGWLIRLGGKKNGSLAAGPDVSTLCVRARMDKRQMCQWESEHVWKMCLPQPFHLLHRGL